MLSDEEKKLLSRYITNVDSNVFALKNLPEVVKGALFSRYSRSSKSLKRLLLDEFLKSDINIIDTSSVVDTSVDEKKAEEFYDRVLLGFGDDSVAELAFAHLAIENVSMIATKTLEDVRIGISPLEKSTRYVYFDKKVNGEYLFYKEPVIMQSDFADDYLRVMNNLFETYSDLLPKIKAYMQERFPKPDDISDRAYNSTIRAKTCDVLRGLLPASTLTNLGLAGNGRSFEYLIIKLRASPLSEFQSLASSIKQELSKIIPSFVKRSFSHHGEMWVDYFNSVNSIFSSKAKNIQKEDDKKPVSVKLVSISGDEDEVIAALFYEYSGLSFPVLLDYVKNLTKDEKFSIVEELLSARKNRRHKPPRAFELLSFTFEVILNFGAYRDLQRHRIMTQIRQLLGTDLGYTLPKEIVDAGYEDKFKDAMASASNLYKEISKKCPFQAQYAVPMAYKVRWLIHLNLREAFHLCELRSSPQGHNDYREVAIQMAKVIEDVSPLLGKMKFLNTENIELNRLEAERRLDKKIEEVKRKYNL